MINVHMRYIRVTEGKIENLKKEGKMTEGKNENLKKEGKMKISTLIFIYTIHFAYLRVYIKFHNPKSSNC